MNIKPRNKNENIITISNLYKCLLQGILIFLVVLCSYKGILDNNYELSLANTISFAILLLSILLISFNLQNKKLTLYNFICSLKDKLSLFINGIIFIMLILFIRSKKQKAAEAILFQKLAGRAAVL